MQQAYRIVALILTMGMAANAKKPPQQTQNYGNTMAFEATCGEMWKVLVPVAGAHKLTPESSDRSGGFMKLRYTGGDSLYRAVQNDVKSLTTVSGFFQVYSFNRFRVNGGSVSLSDNGSGGCNVMVQFDYQGFNSLNEWVALPSNNHFENTMLSDFGEGLKIVRQRDGIPSRVAPSPSVEPTPIERPAPPPPAVLRVKSNPDHADVLIDGNFVGTTPTADMRQTDGAHVIIVRVSGRTDWTRTATFSAGQVMELFAEMAESPDATRKPKIIGLE